MKFLKKYRYPYLFILPFFILFLVFQLIPAIWTFVISLTDWRGIDNPKFIGLHNYQMLMTDSVFWDSVWNTVIYWASGTVFILMLAIIIACLLNYKQLHCRSFFKTATFLPNICASVAVGIIFGLLFEENVGLINQIIISIGGSRVGWLTNMSISKFPVIVLNIWRLTPWYTMIILSGLLSISQDYYEAATVDGANVFQKFIKITLPSLSNILFFCFITVTVDCWKIFNEPYVLKGPGSSNKSLFLYMYDTAFSIFNMGYASAIGCILTLILLLISVAQFIVRKKQGEL